MAQLTGEPKYLQECEPGALVRVLHRADSRFAIAVATRDGFPDRVVLLDEADGFPLVDIGGAEPVISYGRNYRIQEGVEAGALSAIGQSMPGQIEWRMGGGRRAAHLVAKTDRYTTLVDLDTGLLSAQLPANGFAVMQWSVILTPEDGKDAVEVFKIASG